MKLTGLDHVNIHTEDISRLSAWYERVLGLVAGARPASFDFPGAWLYLGDSPIVHLVEADGIGRPRVPAIEHFSLSATGLGTFLRTLDAVAVDHQLVDVPEAGVVQVNIRDCDGNHVHVDFPLSEKPE